MSLSAKADVVMEVLRQEAEGKSPSLPMGGLKLDGFRAGRMQLARDGRIHQDESGRWVPTEEKS